MEHLRNVAWRLEIRSRFDYPDYYYTNYATALPWTFTVSTASAFMLKTAAKVTAFSDETMHWESGKQRRTDPGYGATGYHLVKLSFAAHFY